MLAELSPSASEQVPSSSSQSTSVSASRPKSRKKSSTNAQRTRLKSKSRSKEDQRLPKSVPGKRTGRTKYVDEASEVELARSVEAQATECYLLKSDMDKAIHEGKIDRFVVLVEWASKLEETPLAASQTGRPKRVYAVTEKARNEADEILKTLEKLPTAANTSLTSSTASTNLVPVPDSTAPAPKDAKSSKSSSTSSSESSANKVENDYEVIKIPSEKVFISAVTPPWQRTPTYDYHKDPKWSFSDRASSRSILDPAMFNGIEFERSQSNLSDSSRVQEKRFQNAAIILLDPAIIEHRLKVERNKRFGLGDLLNKRRTSGEKTTFESIPVKSSSSPTAPTTPPSSPRAAMRDKYKPYLMPAGTRLRDDAYDGHQKIRPGMFGEEGQTRSFDARICQIIDERDLKLKAAVIGRDDRLTRSEPTLAAMIQQNNQRRHAELRQMLVMKGYIDGGDKSKDIFDVSWKSDDTICVAYEIDPRSAKLSSFGNEASDPFSEQDAKSSPLAGEQELAEIQKCRLVLQKPDYVYPQKMSIQFIADRHAVPDLYQHVPVFDHRPRAVQPALTYEASLAETAEKVNLESQLLNRVVHVTHGGCLGEILSKPDILKKAGGSILKVPLDQTQKESIAEITPKLTQPGETDNTDKVIKPDPPSPFSPSQKNAKNDSDKIKSAENSDPNFRSTIDKELEAIAKSIAINSILPDGAELISTKILGALDKKNSIKDSAAVDLRKNFYLKTKGETTITDFKTDLQVGIDKNCTKETQIKSFRGLKGHIKLEFEAASEVKDDTLTAGKIGPSMSDNLRTYNSESSFQSYVARGIYSNQPDGLSEIDSVCSESHKVKPRVDNAEALTDKLKQLKSIKFAKTEQTNNAIPMTAAENETKTMDVFFCKTEQLAANPIIACTKFKKMALDADRIFPDSAKQSEKVITTTNRCHSVESIPIKGLKSQAQVTDRPEISTEVRVDENQPYLLEPTLPVDSKDAVKPALLLQNASSCDVNRCYCSPAEKASEMTRTQSQSFKINQTKKGAISFPESLNAANVMDLKHHMLEVAGATGLHIDPNACLQNISSKTEPDSGLYSAETLTCSDKTLSVCPNRTIKSLYPPPPAIVASFSPTSADTMKPINLRQEDWKQTHASNLHKNSVLADGTIEKLEAGNMMKLLFSAQQPVETIETLSSHPCLYNVSHSSFDRRESFQQRYNNQYAINRTASAASCSSATSETTLDGSFYSFSPTLLPLSNDTDVTQKAELLSLQKTDLLEAMGQQAKCNYTEDDIPSGMLSHHRDDLGPTTMRQATFGHAHAEQKCSQFAASDFLQEFRKKLIYDCKPKMSFQMTSSYTESMNQKTVLSDIPTQSCVQLEPKCEFSKNVIPEMSPSSLLDLRSLNCEMFNQINHKNVMLDNPICNSTILTTNDFENEVTDDKCNESKEISLLSSEIRNAKQKRHSSPIMYFPESHDSKPQQCTQHRSATETKSFQNLNATPPRTLTHPTTAQIVGQYPLMAHQEHKLMSYVEPVESSKNFASKLSCEECLQDLTQTSTTSTSEAKTSAVQMCCYLVEKGAERSTGETQTRMSRDPELILSPKSIIQASTADDYNRNKPTSTTAIEAQHRNRIFKTVAHRSTFPLASIDYSFGAKTSATAPLKPQDCTALAPYRSGLLKSNVASQCERIESLNCKPKTPFKRGFEKYFTKTIDTRADKVDTADLEPEIPIQIVPRSEYDDTTNFNYPPPKQFTFVKVHESKNDYLTYSVEIVLNNSNTYSGNKCGDDAKLRNVKLQANGLSDKANLLSEQTSDCDKPSENVSTFDNDNAITAPTDGVSPRSSVVENSTENNRKVGGASDYQALSNHKSSLNDCNFPQLLASATEAALPKKSLLPEISSNEVQNQKPHFDESSNNMNRSKFSNISTICNSLFSRGLANDNRSMMENNSFNDTVNSVSAKVEKCIGIFESSKISYNDISKLLNCLPQPIETVSIVPLHFSNTVEHWNPSLCLCPVLIELESVITSQAITMPSYHFENDNISDKLHLLLCNDQNEPSSSCKTDANDFANESKSLELSATSDTDTTCLNTTTSYDVPILINYSLSQYSEASTLTSIICDNFVSLSLSKVDNARSKQPKHVVSADSTLSTCRQFENRHQNMTCKEILRLHPSDATAVRPKFNQSDYLTLDKQNRINIKSESVVEETAIVDCKWPTMPKVQEIDSDTESFDCEKKRLSISSETSGCTVLTEMPADEKQFTSNLDGALLSKSSNHGLSKIQTVRNPHSIKETNGLSFFDDNDFQHDKTHSTNDILTTRNIAKLTNKIRQSIKKMSRLAFDIERKSSVCNETRHDLPKSFHSDSLSVCLKGSELPAVKITDESLLTDCSLVDLYFHDNNLSNGDSILMEDITGHAIRENDDRVSDAKISKIKWICSPKETLKVDLNESMHAYSLAELSNDSQPLQSSTNPSMLTQLTNEIEDQSSGDGASVASAKLPDIDRSNSFNGDSCSQHSKRFGNNQQTVHSCNNFHDPNLLLEVLMHEGGASRNHDCQLYDLLLEKQNWLRVDASDCSVSTTQKSTASTLWLKRDWDLLHNSPYLPNPQINSQNPQMCVDTKIANPMVLIDHESPGLLMNLSLEQVSSKRSILNRSQLSFIPLHRKKTSNLTQKKTPPASISLTSSKNDLRNTPSFSSRSFTSGVQSEVALIFDGHRPEVHNNDQTSTKSVQSKNQKLIAKESGTPFCKTQCDIRKNKDVWIGKELKNSPKIVVKQIAASSLVCFVPNTKVDEAERKLAKPKFLREIKSRLASGELRVKESMDTAV